MDPLLVTELEAIERDAYSDLYTGAGSAELRARLGLRAERCGRAFVLRSRALDHLLFNRAFGLRCDDPEAEALAESVVARYRAQEIARYVVQVQAGARGSPLCERLTGLGLVRMARGWDKLVRGRERLAAARSSVRAERAGPEDATAIAALIVDGLDLPDAAEELLARLVQRERWHAYVTRDVEGRPYGSLLMYARGEHAYLLVAATDRGQRRRGAERALIAHAVRDALDLGCRELSAETPEPMPGQPSSSHHNLVHAGFRVVQAHDNWAPPAVPANFG